ncbi:MAG: hypothetical protein AAF442_06445 [Pseudomonadota bacterium]
MSNVVFFPDNENFKQRNFPMIHRVMREFGLQAIFDEPPKTKDLNFYLNDPGGDFAKTVIANRFIYNVDLFEIVEADYRRYINARSLSENLSFNWADILNKKFDTLDKAALKKLLESLNEARAFIEYYREKLFIKRPLLVFVFGGSKIYQRACMKICELFNLNTFVLEYFFTGKHLYIEPQYTQIQNNPWTIKRIYDRAKKETGPLKPINLLLSNINVKAQPNTDYVDEILALIKDERLGCVFLQVFDDYSLTNIADDFVLSDELDRIVELALQENDIILLKLHPFEYIKHGARPTKDYLENKFFDEIRLGRIYLVEGMLDEQLSRVNNWYGIVSQYALNLTLMGLSPNYNDAFFFRELFCEMEPYEKTILLHDITEHGFFDKTEKSYEKFLEHLSANLLPSIGCSESDLEKFNNKLYEIKKTRKIVVSSNATNSPVNNRHKRSTKIRNAIRKIRNAIRLLIIDPRSFRAKLFAKLKL